MGNPNRITALNFWIFPVLTPWQDYWAGELNRLQNPFPSRYIQRGAGKGFQAHGMLSMLESWVHNDAGPIPPPQFSTEDLIAYVKANMEHQAVTTINIGIYQDGTVEQSSLEMMANCGAQSEASNASGLPTLVDSGHFERRDSNPRPPA